MFSLVALIKMVVSVFLATLGFAIMFNIRNEKVIYAALGAPISAIAYYFTKEVFQLNAFLCLFYVAVVFSIYSEIMARKLKSPVTTFTICALICYVPGGTMYYTMVALLNGDGSKAGTLMLEALIAAGALAIGIVSVSTLTKMYYKIKKKYVQHKTLEEAK